MSHAPHFNPMYDPLGVSKRDLVNFKAASRDTSALLALAQSVLNATAPYQYEYHPYSIAPAVPQLSLDNLSFRSTAPSIDSDLASEIDDIVDRSRSVSPVLSIEGEVQVTSRTSDASCVHPRPADDSHYPYAVQRKSRTKMRSGVCVWCAAQRLMEMPGRPVLRKRTSGSDADWERWMSELASPQSGFLSYLADVLMPMHALLLVIDAAELDTFYREFAGALIEMALREHRGVFIDERTIMVQVRSSKHHKTARVAKIIRCKYE